MTLPLSPNCKVTPDGVPPVVGVAVLEWVWVVSVVAAAVGGSSVEAVFGHEDAARQYVASQPEEEFRVEAYLLLQEAPAPLYGLLARSARFIAELQRQARG